VSSPSYPEICLQGKFPFLRRKETISAGNFIEWSHLQKGPPSLAARATAWHFLLTQKMVNLALIRKRSAHYTRPWIGNKLMDSSIIYKEAVMKR